MCTVNLSSSFFVGRLAIPQVETPAVASLLNSEIVDKTEKYLLGCFGASLYEAFLNGNNDDEKWAKLINGCIFSTGFGKAKWPGLKEPIALFVRYHWLRRTATNVTNSGEKTTKKDGATNSSSLGKQVVEYNAMVGINKLLYTFLTSSGDYPEFNINELSSDFFAYINPLNM